MPPTVVSAGKPFEIAVPVRTFIVVITRLPPTVVRFKNDATVTRAELVSVRAPPTLSSRGAATVVTRVHGPTVIAPVTVTTDWSSEATCASVMIVDTILIDANVVAPAVFEMAVSMSAAVEV